MKQSLSKELKFKNKELFKQKNILGFIDEINVLSLIITNAITVVIYIGLILISKYIYIPIFFIDGIFSKGLILEELPSLVRNIEIGIFSIFFSLVILITGYIYNSKSEEGRKILLKSSKLFPLIIYNLLLLLSFIFNEILWDGYLQMLPLALNIFFIISSLYHTLRIISMKELFYKESKKLLFNNIEMHTGQLVLERLAKNYKYDLLSINNISAIYNPLEKNGIIFYSTKKGTIKNISLWNLKSEIKNINKSIKHNYNNTIFSSPEQSYFLEEKEQLFQLKINRTIGDYVDENTGLICLKTDNINIIDEIDIRRIENGINKCFNISEAKSVQKRLKQIFLGIEDDIIVSIKNKKRKDLEEIREFLIEVPGKFSSLIKYNFEAAKRERTSIGGGWENIKLVVEIIRHASVEAMEIDDQDILLRIISIPFLVMINAATDGDHYIFQEFSTFINYLYFLSNKYNHKQSSGICFDRSLIYPQEISNLYLSRLIDESSFTNIHNNYFSVPLLKSYQEILKELINSNAEKSKFVDALSGFKNLFNSNYYHVNNDDDNTFYKLQDESYLDVMNITIKGKIFSEIQLDKIIISLALLNFALKKSNYIFNEYSEELSNILPKNINYITYVFEKAIDFVTEEKWGWYNWEIEYSSIPVFRSIDFDLSKAYLVFILKHVTSFSDIKDRYLIGKNLYYYINNKESKIIKMLSLKPDDILYNSVSEEELKKIPLLLKYFQKIVEKFEINKNNIISGSPLDDNLIKQFKDNVLEGYKNNFGLKDLYSFVQKKKQTNKIDTKKIKGGYFQIIDKEPYVAENQGIVGDQSFGVGMKEFENFQIFTKWLNFAKIKTIQNISDEIKDRGTKYIILSTFKNRTAARYFFGENFTDNWRVEQNNELEKAHQFVGNYNLGKSKIPILNYFIRSDQEFQEKVYLLNTETIGTLIELVHEPNQDPLLFQITDLNFNKEKREELIKKNPDWLENIEDKEKYLKTKLVLNIVSEFSIEFDGLDLKEIKK